ncbi:MAG: site-2 protease family protein [Chitinophagaceae bacterium]
MEPPLLPKFPPPSNNTNWLTQLISLGTYIALGLLILPNSKIVLSLTFIVLLHEAGHLVAMRAFHYKDTGIFFIPLLGGLARGTKREISQKQSVIVLLAGPLPGILVGILLLSIIPSHYGLTWTGILFIFLNGLNLLPVYPMDGGQLFNRIFLDEEGNLSRLFKLASTLFLAFVAIKFKLYPLLLFPLLQLWQLRPDKIADAIEKSIREENIPTNLDYQELPDEDYWKLRTILIRLHPACKGLSTQTEQYSENEQKIQVLIESLLDRNLIEDLTLWGKLMFGLLWISSLLLSAYFLFLQQP